MGLIEFMYNQSATQFRFKPGSFRRHDIVGISNIDQLLHRNRIQCKGNFHFVAVDSFLQFTQTTDSSNKVNPFVCAQIFNVENRLQDQVGEDRDIKYTNGVIIVIGVRVLQSENTIFPPRYMLKLCK